MKNLATILILASALNFLMVSCNNDEPEVYWYSYGTYYESDESTVGFIVNLDNGQELLPVEFSGNTTNYEYSTKVFIEYNIVSETESTVNAKVTGMTSILTKDVLQLTEENKDSIGNDGVFVFDGDIWLSERHLNVAFSYYGYSYGSQHFINLIKPIDVQLDSDGNQILEFKHNANNDIPNSRFNSLVAFDMWSLHEDGMDSLNFVFKSMYYDSTEYTYTGTYYFNGEAPTKSFIKEVPQFSERVY